MVQVKNHFNEESNEFDEIIQKLIPYYNEMVEAISEILSFDRNQAIDVIDLGCGTGTVAKAIKMKYPYARITCLDIAENMIEVAKSKLLHYNDIEYVVSDFYNYNFNKTYDVIVSSLALHHLHNDGTKKILYTKCFKYLKKNGCFYNADLVLASSKKHYDLFLQKWIDYMKRVVSEEEIKTKWLAMYKEEDYPVKLIKQLNWLKDIGFKDIDVIWKYYNFAVYGGRK